MKLKGKAVLITGGGSGLGRETALTFAREGARIGINDIRPESAHNVVTEIGRAGGEAIALVADVAQSVAARKVVDDFVAKFGTIDVLINNAGIAHAERFPEATVELSDEGWHEMIAIHLDGTFYFTREALKIMIPKKSGRIINLGSVAGTVGLAGSAHYCAAKGGIIAFTKAVAREVVSCGILVNCIAPGFIETPMTAVLRSEIRQLAVAMTPLGRFGEAREIASAALFLASDDGSYMTGQVLSPNGGFAI